MKKAVILLLGACTGLLNGLFGSGGGMVLLPALKLSGLEAKRSHATCLAVILPLSLISGWMYLSHGSADWQQALAYLPGAVAGAIAGGILLPRLSTLWLRRIFGGMAVFAACRLFF